MDPAISGGGLLLDVGSHMLDIPDFLLGPVRNVQGQASNLAQLYQAEDPVTGFMMYESGVQGIASCCFAAATAEDRTEIIVSQGDIIFSTFGEDPILVKTPQCTLYFNITNPPNIQQGY